MHPLGPPIHGRRVRKVTPTRDARLPLAARARRPSDALLALQAVALLALGAAAAVLGWPARTAPDPDTATRLEAVDVARAADVLSAQVDLRLRDLGAALLPGEEDALVGFLRLQAEAADLVLGPVRFTGLPREGLVQPVEMVLDLEGACYDVPLFVDGLYRQSRVVEVHSASLEAPGPRAARVRTRLEAWFWRPYVPDPGGLGPLLAGAADASARSFAAQALASAAALEACDAFGRALPGLQDRAAVNRRLVLRTLPTLVRRLPGSPLDWVGATFDGAEVHVALDRGTPGAPLHPAPDP